MAFFEINKIWKLIIYWLGISGCFGSLLGWILLGIWFNLNWGEKIGVLFKIRKKESKIMIINKKLKGVEKIFFLLGFFVLFLLILLLIAWIYTQFTGKPF